MTNGCHRCRREKKEEEEEEKGGKRKVARSSVLVSPDNCCQFEKEKNKSIAVNVIIFVLSDLFTREQYFLLLMCCVERRVERTGNSLVGEEEYDGEEKRRVTS